VTDKSCNRVEDEVTDSSWECLGRFQGCGTFMLYLEGKVGLWKAELMWERWHFRLRRSAYSEGREETSC
jgi:hypothetical protein